MAKSAFASKVASYCEIPEQMHPLCREYLDLFLAGRTSVHTPAYACNMVDSNLIPMVECLLDTYASGVLLIPFIQ
jgi:hypothetical protein